MSKTKKELQELFLKADKAKNTKDAQLFLNKLRELESTESGRFPEGFEAEQAQHERGVLDVLGEDIKETAGNLAHGMGRGSAGVINTALGLAEKSPTLKSGIESMGVPNAAIRQDAIQSI